MSDPKLNEDVYSHLLSFVSSPADLLALSLSNKELYSLAVPELIYRSIRCRLGHNAVWKHLIANPAHASRVRELEIQRENLSGRGSLDERERFPGNHSNNSSSPMTCNLAQQSIRGQQIEASEHLLIEAIHFMVNLESFIWDRWVPVVNLGHEVLQLESGNMEDANSDVLKTYQGDIWISLRDHTQLRRLKIVDLGSYDAIVPNACRIFDSTIFTLRNLTHIGLKIYYSQGDDDDDGEEDNQLLAGRVNISRLQDFLLGCPNLQRLTLAIIDRDFFDIGGVPFTNISSIFSSAHWPDLSYLSLSDVIIDTEIMTNFVNNHLNIRTIASFLSISGDNLPEIPFSLDPAIRRSDSLSNLETLQVAPALARQILKAIRQSSAMRNLSSLEPCDWNATENEEDQFEPSFDDMWGVHAADNDQDFEDKDEVSQGNLLQGFPNLHSLGVQDVQTFAQLGKLALVTPELEFLELDGHCFRALFNNPFPHREFLPYLSKWPHLISFKTFNLWPSDSSGLSPEVISEIVNEITAACPTLRDILWIDGSVAKLVRDENGSAKLELEGWEKND